MLESGYRSPQKSIDLNDHLPPLSPKQMSWFGKAAMEKTQIENKQRSNLEAMKKRESQK